VAVRIVAPAAALRLSIAACACSVLPDADSLPGVPYEHSFGHRGFFHSLLFAALMAAAGAAWMRAERPYRVFGLLFVVGASHGVLDAMTDAGLGIAFFAPFDNSRYFLPWRPIVVSPIGAAAFFSRWGLEVVVNELLWIWLPVGLVSLAVVLVRRSLCRKDAKS